MYSVLYRCIKLPKYFRNLKEQEEYCNKNKNESENNKKTHSKQTKPALFGGFFVLLGVFLPVNPVLLFREGSGLVEIYCIFLNCDSKTLVRKLLVEKILA